jgi:hypothetical protein
MALSGAAYMLTLIGNSSGKEQQALGNAAGYPPAKIGATWSDPYRPTTVRQDMIAAKRAPALVAAQ